MAALTENRATTRASADQFAFSMGVDIIYEGSLVAIASATGYALPGSDAADRQFVGVAAEKVDNSGGSAGDKTVRVWQTGVFEFTYGAGGGAQPIVGELVCITDDQSVDLPTGTSNEIPVGRIVELVSATSVKVDIGRRHVS